MTGIVKGKEFLVHAGWACFLPKGIGDDRNDALFDDRVFWPALWHKMIHWLICESTCRAMFTDYFWPTNYFACTVSTCYRKSCAYCRKALAMAGTKFDANVPVKNWCASCEGIETNWHCASLTWNWNKVLRLAAEKLLLTSCAPVLSDEPKFGSSVRIPSRRNTFQFHSIHCNWVCYVARILL